MIALISSRHGSHTELSQDGRTPLHWASSSPGGIEIVSFLLDQKGIEVDKTDPSGWTALHMAGKRLIISFIRYFCFIGIYQPALGGIMLSESCLEREPIQINLMTRA